MGGSGFRVEGLRFMVQGSGFRETVAAAGRTFGPFRGDAPWLPVLQWVPLLRLGFRV